MEYITSDSSDEPKIIQDVISGQKSLLKCVEDLGPKITSAIVGERAEAVGILSRIVKDGGVKLNWSENELSVMTEFFIAKLKDHHSLIPVTLEGILALSQLNVPPQACTRLVQNLFSEVPCQSQQQKDRQKFFLVLRNFLRRKVEALKPLGFDFVSGFIQSVDGEKDPRNLVIIFNMVPVITKEFTLGPFAEELFEVLACYFPIEFTPPPNDPFGVTKEELREGLRTALCSSASFAEFCLTLILEKLDSDLADAKLDSFSLLEHAAPVYKPKDLDPFLDPIWLAVRRELFAGSLGGEVEKSALSAFTAVLRATSVGIEVVQNGEDLEIVAPERYAFKEAVESALKQCLHHLSEPEHKLMYPSAQTLLAMAAASEHFMKLVVSRAMPLMIRLLIQRTSLQERFTITDITCLFFLQCRKAIKPHLLQIAGLLFSFVNESDEKIVCAALRGLTVCFEDLEDEDRRKFAEQLLHVGTSELSTVREEAKRSLGAIAKKDVTSDLVQTKVYSPLLERLQAAQKDDLPRLLELLPSVCTSADMIENFVGRLTLTPEEVQDPGPIIKCLTQMCSGISNSSSKFPCTQWSLDICDKYLHRTALDQFTDILVDLSALLRTYCANLYEYEHILKEVDILLDFSKRIMCDGDDELAVKNQRKILLVEASFGSFRHLPDYSLVADLAYTLATKSVDPVTQTSASRLYAALLNKSESAEFVQNGVNAISRGIETPNNVRLLSWGTKGLAMRGHTSLSELVDVMISLLCSDLGEVASEGFRILMEDTVECLNKECHGNVRFLYKQRIFQLSLAKLIKLYNEEEGDKRNVVMAMMNQLPHVPHAILAAHLKELLPLIIMSLQTLSGTFSSIASMLAVLNSLILEASDLIYPYATDMTTRLLGVAKESELMINRKAALTCITSLATLPEVHILPIRDEILRDLVKCLGDKKRLVRQAAAEARNTWFLVSQPGRKK